MTTHNAASASYTDVAAALALCSSGDTLAVPAGTATWSTPLTITIGLHIQGNGIGSTIITNDTTGSHGAIEFIPASGQYSAGFEVSGFSFNVNDKYMIWIESTSGASISNIKIHDNAFYGFDNAGYCFIFGWGLCMGVVYDNTFAGANVWQNIGGNITTWDAVTAAHDDGNELYIEDNVFNITGGMGDGVRGARYVVRHNDINITRTSGSISPMFDVHGNQLGHLAAGMEVAIYENSIDNTNNTLGCFFDQRGAMALVYNNTFIGTYMGAFSIRNEYTEGTPSDDWYIDTTNPQPQHVVESYYWTNVDDYPHLFPNNYDIGYDAGDEIVENVEYFLQRGGTFDGSGAADHGGGVGVGLLSARPSSGLTAGVGYWATDTNTLYRATGATTWEAYYTPYTYPHPLRAGDSGGGPARKAAIFLLLLGIR